MVDTPVEECELEPRQNCRHATKQVPKLVSVQVMVTNYELSTIHEPTLKNVNPM